MIMGVYVLAVYGLAVYGVRESAVRAGSDLPLRDNDHRDAGAPLGYLRRE